MKFSQASFRDTAIFSFHRIVTSKISFEMSVIICTGIFLIVLLLGYLVNSLFPQLCSGNLLSMFKPRFLENYPTDFKNTLENSKETTNSLQKLQYHLIYSEKQFYRVWVCTVATKLYFPLRHLISRCNQEGIIVNVFGLERRWPLFGFGIKLFYQKEIANYLIQEKLEGIEDLILFIDAADIIFSFSRDGGGSFLEELVSKYKLFRSPLILGAEINCWPDDSLVRYYPSAVHKHTFPFLNSGFLLGSPQSIALHLNANSFHLKDDDQLYWTKVFLFSNHSAQSKISLDHNAQLVLCIAKKRMFSDYGINWNTGRWWYQNLSEQPSVVHFHGGPGKRLIWLALFLETIQPWVRMIQ